MAQKHQAVSAQTPVDECHFFYEDEVYRLTRNGQLQFGMVVENSEYYSSDEDEDDEESDEGEEEKLKPGMVRVAWHPKGNEQVIPEAKLGLADRSLMPGDVVRRFVRGKDTQGGYCRNVKVFATVQIVGTTQVVTRISSGDLENLEAFNADVGICYESWIGVIKEVKNKITLKLSDGSICALDEDLADSLENLCEDRDEDCQFNGFEYFPGLVLKGPKSIYEKGEFLSKSPDYEKKSKFMRSTVLETRVESVGVHWQCKAYNEDNDVSGSSSKIPDYSLTKDELKKVKKLYVFGPSTLQVGDRNFYTLTESDTVMTKSEWNRLEQLHKRAEGTKEPVKKVEPKKVDNVGEPERESANDSSSSEGSDAELSSEGEAKKGKPKRMAVSSKAMHKKKTKMRRAKPKQEKRRFPRLKTIKVGEKYVVETIRTQSFADVIWQDGTVEENVSSKELFPIHHLDEQEFFCGDYVCRNDDAHPNPHEYGVIQRVDHAGRTCQVKWFKTYTAGNEPRPLELDTNEEPVYDLKDHPDFRYRPSSIVIRVANFEDEKSSCFGGQVLDNLTSGKVMVWWADEAVSECWPQDLYKIGEYDSDDEGGLWSGDADDWLNEDDEDGDDRSLSSWETLSETSEPGDVAKENVDVTNLRPKLAANIEKARIAMTRLEEIFHENPNLQTNFVMKQLLDVYKDCRCVDRLMGTSFFHEHNFEGLLEKIRDRGKVGTYQQQVNAQLRRLFDRSPPNLKALEVVQDPSDKTSSNISLPVSCATDPVEAGANLTTEDDGASSSAAPVGEPPTDDPNPEVESSKCPVKGSEESEDDSMREGMARLSQKLAEANQLAQDMLVDFQGAHQPWDDDQQVCARLCSLMKAQLVKALEEVVERYGGQGAMFTQEDLKESPGEAEDDLEGIMGQILSSDRDPSASNSTDIDGAEWEPSVTSPMGKGAGIPKGVSSQDIAQALYGTPTKTESEPNPSGQIAEEMDDEMASESAASTEVFSIEESAPNCHKFKLSLFQPIDPKSFIKFVRKEVNLLKTNLPEGIVVKAFEDRMDLYSVMIKGPRNTPYEDGLFFFDFQLTAEYPKTPPACSYISYCTDRLNPNLYEDGKVCVSLLGTWSGKGTETWTPNSNMLQLLISIQGLILVSEPYFNEAGYERQKGTQQGRENSRMYNEMVVLKLVQSTTRLIINPPPTFKTNITEHFEKRGQMFVDRLEQWLNLSMKIQSNEVLDGEEIPEFPLIPASKGFCISVRKAVQRFKEVLSTLAH